MKVSAIIAAAGKGSRAGFEKNKLLVEWQGSTPLSKTVGVFQDSGLIDEIIITCSSADLELITKAFPFAKTVLGGSTRTDSVKNALKEVGGDIVLIHDGARPFLTPSLIERCIDGANKFGSGIAAVANRDTLCYSDGETISGYAGKQGIYSIQTPQAFKTALIQNAYDLAGNQSFNDDSEVYGKFISPPHLVAGEFENVKLTFAEDFAIPHQAKEKLTRTGVGFDCHKLVEERKLILGGIEIPHTKGLLGHSDADVLTHAIMDAILSACALRDIGYHFPDTDERYKGADSVELLKEVLNIIKEKGYKVSSVSATIMAEKPKLLKHIPAITQNLASVLGIKEDMLGIGATTLEGLGFVGREEGICVHATATVVSL